MSEDRTNLSNSLFPPFDFSIVSEEVRHRAENETKFITGQRLSVIMESMGRDRFVHASGRSWKQMSRYIQGDKPASEVLQALAAETLTSIDWLANGTIRTPADLAFEKKLLTNLKFQKIARLGNPRPEPERSTLGYTVDLIDRILAALQLDASAPANSGTDPSMGTASFVSAAQSAIRASENRMVPLPFYDGVQASAGIGLTPQVHAQAEAVVSFDERFLRDKGAVPERCNVITARGDSMAPTIPDGSLLVVDHSQTQVGNGYIMVINLGDDLLVKRVHRRIDGLIDLISDNPAYPRETIGGHMLDQLRVVGRVVYFCRVP